MKDVYRILEQKEADLARVRRELESLQTVAPLLSEDPSDDPVKKPISAEQAPGADLKATGTEGLFSSILAAHPGFWKSLTQRK